MWIQSSMQAVKRRLVVLLIAGHSLMGAGAGNACAASVDQPLAIDGKLPEELNQSFYCETGNSTYTLILGGDSAVRYSGNQGVLIDGRYQVVQNTLNFQLDSGDRASSTGHLTAGKLLVAMKLLSADGQVSRCITRKHTVGDTLPVDVVVRCGRRNISGEESNTFTLRQDGSAVWESLYELPGGVDTTRRQRLGTFLFDATAGSVGMAFKQLNGEGLLFFTGVGDEIAFRMTAAPETGDGAQAAGQHCEYL